MKKLILSLAIFFGFSFCHVDAAENIHRGFRDAFFSFNTEVGKVLVSAGESGIIMEPLSAGDRLRASISRSGFIWATPIHFSSPQ